MTEARPDELAHVTDGSHPLGVAIDLERETMRNKFYRYVRATTTDMQLVYMRLKAGEEIPFETHDGSQFIRVEDTRKNISVKVVTRRRGTRTMDLAGEQYEQEALLAAGEAMLIPPGVEHYVQNVGRHTAHIYTLYAPPQHGPATEQVTKRAAEVGEAADESARRAFFALRRMHETGRVAAQDVQRLAARTPNPDDSRLLYNIAAILTGDYATAEQNPDAAALAEDMALRVAFGRE